MQSHEPDRPVLAKVIEQNRVMALFNSFGSTLLFFLTVGMYLWHRGDIAWRIRVPYHSALVVLQDNSLPCKIPATAPTVAARSQMLAQMKQQLGCDAGQSVRCDCLMDHFDTSMEPYATLAAGNVVGRYKAFREATE
eukprot:413192-Rhodomonas_salina.1